MTESDFDRRNRLYRNEPTPGNLTPEQINDKDYARKVGATLIFYFFVKFLEGFFRSLKQQINDKKNKEGNYEI